MSTARPDDGPRRTSQTLSRGLSVLKSVAHLPDGGTAHQLAAATGLERTVVHRLLNTLVADGFAERTPAGAYRIGPEARALASLAGPSVIDFAQSRLQVLADKYAGTAMLCLAETDAIVAVAVAVPTNADSHLAYRRGSRHPIDRGAGAWAVRAGRPPVDGEPASVATAREQGWIIAHGEVEEGAHAVAAPVSRGGDTLDACAMFLSHRADSVQAAAPDVVVLAAEVRAHALQAG
ncbi:helix-turn-helix domain-containing protein [Amycolatopsis sp. NPDC004625]|uniref:helix-turn-helix domain-containing protein n=1 Tax=Amycolatopsis sp. NPDC004625 TaxID=3154670 RepID=UPI0033B63020